MIFCTVTRILNQHCTVHADFEMKGPFVLFVIFVSLDVGNCVSVTPKTFLDHQVDKSLLDLTNLYICIYVGSQS